MRNQAFEARVLRELTITADAIWPRFALGVDRSLAAPFLVPLKEFIRCEWKSAVPIRGFLTRVGYEFGGGRFQDVVDVAAAVELCQIATVIVDDVIDRSDVRNGESIYKAFGEGIAVVTGELLKASASTLIVTAVRKKKNFVNAFEAVRHFELIYQRICFGQLLDLWYESARPITELEYLKMIECTTGGFLEGAAALGAILSGLSAPLTNALCEYARCLGLAFQIYDDVFDVGPQVAHAKPFANDVKRRKQRLPLIHLLRTCSRRERREINRVLNKRRISNDDARHVVAFMKRRGSLDYSIRRARRFCSRAKAVARGAFQPSQRELLLGLVELIQSDDRS